MSPSAPTAGILRGASRSDEPWQLPPRRPPEPPRAADDPVSLLHSARAEAEALLQQAAAEAQQLRQAAHAEGHREGWAAAAAELSDGLAATHAAAMALEEQRHALAEAAAGEAVQLAVEIAAKLIRAEVAAAPERVLGVVQAAIRRAADRSRLLVHVHPDDLAACREAAPEIMRSLGGIGSLEVLAEPRVDRGSCTITTPAGDVDATFSSQLSRVLEALAQPPDAALTGDEPAA